MIDTLVSDQDLLRRAVRELATRTGLPLAFGGFERQEAVVVSQLIGTRTPYLNGLEVRATRGLGGKALIEKRPRLALDYRSARHITHDYDRAILGEGISTLFAVPLLVSGRTRGMLYCGSWSMSPFRDDVTRTALAIASDLSTELRVRDEVRRELAKTPAPTGLDSVAKEELRATFSELRSVAALIDDESVRDRITSIEQRLAQLARTDDEQIEEIDVHLSPREMDVLACAALGSTNAEIAATLSLKEGTVKSYMQSAMAKLDASTRHAAVTKARRAGLLP